MPEPSLVGAWTLVAAVAVDPDGSTRPVTFIDGAEHATGTLVYTADGTVVVAITGHPRPDFRRSAKTPNAGAADAVALLRTFYAYSGTYDVDPVHHRIVQHVGDSLWPDEIGKTYARTYRLDGDRLSFDTDPLPVAGGTVVNRLIWTRARR